MEEKKTQLFELVKSLKSKGLMHDDSHYIAQADGLLMGYAIVTGISYHTAVTQYNVYNKLMLGF